jgi:hypothetical protein
MKLLIKFVFVIYTYMFNSATLLCLSQVFDDCQLGILSIITGQHFIYILQDIRVELDTDPFSNRIEWEQVSNVCLKPMIFLEVCKT